MKIELASLIALSLLITLLVKAFYCRAIRDGLPPALTSLLLTGLTIYISCLLPGICFRFDTVYFNSLFMIITVGILYILKFNFARHHIAYDIMTSGWPDKIYVRDFLLLAMGLLLATPILSYLRYTLPAFLLDANYKLEWDVVAYHLPSVIGFLKERTLWSVVDPYQSYSYGFELISLFLSFPYHSHYGIGLGSLYAIALMLLTIGYIAQSITTHEDDLRGSWLPLTILACGIWASIFPSSITDIGKNDIFMCACIMAGQGYMLRILFEKNEKQLFQIRSMAGVGFGLALATKPSAFLYVPFLAIANAYAYHLNCTTTDKRHIKDFIYSVGLPIGIALIIGGFWIVRNLLVLSEATPFREAFNLAIIFNLDNSNILHDKRSVFLLLLGLGVMTPIVKSFIRGQNQTVKRQSAFLIAFHLNCFVALLVTPHFLSYNPANEHAAWQIRLAMPYFANTAILASILTIRLSNRYFSIRRKGTTFILGGLVFILVNITVAYRFSSGKNSEISYATIAGTRDSSLQNWVRSQSDPIRIYAIGIAPYVLYGASWANTIFYDLHATSLAPIKGGMIKIAALARDFRPDYILISKKAPGYSSDTESLINWMKTFPDIFTETRIDDSIVSFRVHPDHDHALSPLIPLHYKLLMGG